MGRAFASSFLTGDPASRNFLALDFRDPASRVAKTRAVAAGRVSATLLAVLRAQDQRLPPSPARRANIDTLATPGSAAVVTGQQVALFLGPLYTIYKAASAIAVARALEQASGVRCVPLFWLQTEDHDFAEIDHCHFMDATGSAVRLELPSAGHEPDARVSIKHRALGNGVLTALEVLERTLGTSEHAAKMLAVLRAHYRPERSLGDAFGAVLATLFADEGLIVFDPREEAIARLASPVYETSITRSEEISRRLMDRRDTLRTAGFQEQVHVRPGCPLVFFHQGDGGGGRFRLERRGARWGLAGTPDVIDEPELLATLARDPLRFSTSAMLRPIVQDTLFPTAAYVGGPAELSYFAQLGPLYELFGMAPPLVIPRARFRLIDEKTRSLLAKVGLRPEQIEQPMREALLRVPHPKDADSPDTASLRASFAKEVLPHLEHLERVVTAQNPHLSRPAQRTRDTIIRAVDRLTAKSGRAVIEKDGIAMRRLERLQAALFPEGVPQERFYSWPAFACRHGSHALKEKVMSALAPFSGIVQDLFL